LGQCAPRATRATKPKRRSAPHTVNRTVRNAPELFIAPRTARKPKVAAYLRAKSEGKLEPVSGRKTRTSSGEGRGRAMTGPSQAPRTHIPAKLRIARSAARQPARTQERAKTRARIRRTQGNSAVRETPAAQFRFVGARDCTQLSTATSPGK